MPPVFAESTEVLAPAKVGVTVAGGAGGMGYLTCRTCGDGAFAAGALARVRVGIGGHQELGALAFGAVTANANSSGIGAVGGGAVSYKLGAARWLAFVADAGAIDQAFTGDVGLIVAPYTDSAGRQLYTGIRGSVAIPIDVEAIGATGALTAPVGFVVRPSASSRLFLEAGVTFGTAYNTYFGVATTRGLGGYGAIAIEVMSR